jgi:hypothetical protein
MTPPKTNPAARAGAYRVQTSVALLKAADPFPTLLSGDCLAVAIVSHRFRIAIPRARAVCELAGLGGRW